MAFLEHFRRRVSRLACTSVVAVVGAFVVSACSGDSVANPEPQATGNVQLELTGFPAGSGFGGVTYKLTRGDREVVLGAGASTSGIPTGTWTFTAPVVTIGGVEYRPEPASQTIVVSKSGSVNAQVTYTAVTGTLVVTASGLPALVPAEFTITGVNGFTRTVKSISETFTSLLPGRYTIAAVRVQTNAGSYDPATTSQEVTVVGGATANSVLAYGEASSSVAVDVSGLPLNVDAAVTLTPPAGSATPVLRSSRTLGSAGRWTMSAAIVRSGGSTYTPSPARADSSVLPGDSLRFGVRYTLSTGALAVQVSGAPDGSLASVSVTGPNGYSSTLTGTTTLTDLEPGTYTLSASAITSGGRTYRPSPATRQVVVEASLVAAGASFSYAQVASTLVVSVAGAPGGSENMIRVTGPQGFDRTLSSTTVLDGIAPGAYTITASDIVQAAATWRAATSVVQRTIAGDARDSVAIDYALSTGSVAVMVSGLPAGAIAAANLSGPDGFARGINASTTLTGLAPGSYTLEASNVTVSGVVYVPGPASQQLFVFASLVATPATITYSPQNATLVVTIAGHQGSTVPQVAVSGPSGFSRTINTSTTFRNLGAGTYTVSAPNFSAGGQQYTPSPAVTQRVLSASGYDSVGINYSVVAATTGALTVVVSGLPNGVSGAVSLVGPSTNRTIVSTTTATDLAPGSYSLTAANVTSGGVTYAATPSSQTASVASGATTTATITYAAVAAPTSDDLVIEYAYVTQAVQRPDGNVPLVANRAALLRVFAKNNRDNTLKPDVRVRIYDGATLVRTVMIAAPEASVRQSVDQSTLAASWNTTLSASDLTPSLRILVDVDPSNTVVESNEGNNVWPAGGSPRSITVVSVPDFTVRFIPVVVGALSGNVSAANMSQFLRQTRLQLPVETVVSDVRLPFVSSAMELQSNDANSNWLTVLSEMNALRSADGAPSTMHYYGVVKVAYTSGVAGYGYVGGRSAIGWDYLPSGDGVAAHEWGHNFNRPHSPCGVFGDPAYPYGGGQIGQYGWNSTTNMIVQPTATDFMGYCNNNWTSDWTWQQVMNYRTSSGMQASAASVGASTARDGLMVWGRVVNGRVILEPAFRVASAPTAPVSGSTFRVEALDANGNTLLDLPIEASRVDHVTTHEERQFAVVLPWTQALESALASLRVRDVRTPLSAATRVSETARRVRGSQPASSRIDAGLAEPSADVERSATRDRLRWNSGAYPMAVVRDAATGQTLGFLRRSGDAFISRGRAVDVTYTDGVRSVTRRVAAGATR